MNKKVVVLGGGTGLPAILRGIKYIKEIDITAIVTIADSGGSTGVLSKHFDIPAVGDLRRVLASLSRRREQLEQTMEYRFKDTKTDLDGHTMGNLFLATHVLMKKNFTEGIKAASLALNIQGTVLPVSGKFNHLHAELEDGNIIEGEDNIGHSDKPIRKVFYKEGEGTKDAVNAILDADLVIFGIGSLYTSLIANLIYPNIKDALKATKAEVVYFSNIFTQHGETDNMKLSDHINAIEKHTHKGIIDKVIYSNTKLSADIIKSYTKDKQEIIENDIENAILADLATVDKSNGEDQVRHAEEKVEKIVKELL